MLEVERAREYNMPDEEFTEAYQDFQNSVEETISTFTKAVSFPLLPIGSLVAKGISAGYHSVFGGDLKPIPRESETSTLNIKMTPDTLRKEVQYIMKHSKPDCEDTHEKEEYLQDLNKLKQFIMGIIPIISALGVSQACVQKYLYEGIVRILNSIDMTNERHIVNASHESYAVEVKGNGNVVIASFLYSFRGEIKKNCCWDSQLVNVELNFKVWKFSSTADLKKEYMKIVDSQKSK